MREPIQEQLALLAVTIRFLASGASFTCSSYLFKILNQLVSNIVHEVCDTNVRRLKLNSSN